MSDFVAEPSAWGRSLGFWTRVTLLWMMAITVTGATVRLTGSGLGCTDWPTCEVNTELEAPGFHSFIEFGNRIISGLAIIPVIGAWLAARRGNVNGLRFWFVAMIGGFIGQVLLGMLVTRSELDPRVVLGHFLLSIVLIFIAVMLDHGARNHLYEVEPDSTSSADSRRTLAHLARLAVVFTAIVITVGTLVTGSGPHTGSEKSGEPIPRLGFDIREVTRAHSILVWVLGAVLLWALIVARRSGAHQQRWLSGLIILGAAQGAVGYVQYFTGVPELLVGIHITGAVVLWALMVWFAVQSSTLHAMHQSVDESADDPSGVMA